MEKSRNWQNALTRVKADCEKNATGPKKSSFNAPGLCTPAGLIAVFIVMHPDAESEFHDRIGRL